MEENKSEAMPPIHVDEEIEVEVISRGARGDGVAKYNNFIVFVRGTNVGDKVKVVVEKVFKKFGIARKLIVSEDDI